MSTTPQSATTASYDDGERVPPTDLYDHYVYYSDEWCSACFARIRDVEATPVDHDHLGTNSNAPTETRHRRDAGTLGYDYDTHDAYGHKRSYHPQTYCGECGANGGSLPDATLPKRVAIDRCDQLVTCLATEGVAIDGAALKRFVQKAKEREALAGYDYEIFSRGVAFARRRAVDE